MGLEEIKAALGDKAELVSEIEVLFNNSTSNVDRIGVLESELSGAIARRKDLHGLVSRVTGLNELSEDNLTKFASNADEGLKADNETLQANMAALKDSYDGLSSKHEAEISEMILKDTMRSLGISDRVQNDRAFSELTKLVLDGAEREGANFVFKKEGKTLYDEYNKPLNVEDRILQLQSGEYSYLFKQAKGAGGGDNKLPPMQQTKMQGAVSSVLSSFK